MFFELIGSLIPLAVLGAIVYAIVRAVSGHRERSVAEGAPGSVRRLFLFGSLYGALHLASWGVAGLLAKLGDRSGDIAEPLAMSLVSVPVAFLLGRWAWRTMADPAERGLAVTAYVNLTLFTALVVIMATGFSVGAWLIAGDDFSGFALAALGVWSVVWAGHWSAWKRYEADISHLHVLVGAAAGLAMAAVAAWILLTQTLRLLLDAGTALDLASFKGDDFLRPFVGVAVGAVVLAWYWLVNGLRAERDPTWHAYVVLVGVLGGLITAVVGAGIAAFGILQWWLGEPGVTSAVRHFEDFIPAVSALAAGSLVWMYHRLVVLSGAPSDRTEVHRVYDYVVAAVGLVTAMVGSVLLIIGLQEALFPPDDGGRFESSINTFLGAFTSLVVGAPLWLQAWRRAGRHARLSPEPEASSPTRRTYLFGVLGLGGIVAFGALLTLMVAIFNALFEDGGGELRDGIQVPIALLVTVGAVTGHHWQTLRRERSLVTAPVHAKDVMLVTGDTGLAAAVRDMTGARVSVLHRLDGSGDLIDPEEVARAVESDEHQRLLVLAGPNGGVQVIPYR